MRNSARWAGVPLASAAMLAGVNMAQAQQTEGAALEEVIVTAQKRSEDLQKVPISLFAGAPIVKKASDKTEVFSFTVGTGLEF